MIRRSSIPQQVKDKPAGARSSVPNFGKYAAPKAGRCKQRRPQAR